MFTAGLQGSKGRALFCGTCDSSFKSFTRTEITARVKPYITMERRTGERYMINRFAPGIKMRPSRMKWLNDWVSQNILWALYKVIAAHCCMFCAFVRPYVASIWKCDKLSEALSTISKWILERLAVLSNFRAYKNLFFVSVVVFIGSHLTKPLFNMHLGEDRVWICLDWTPTT